MRRDWVEKDKVNAIIDKFINETKAARGRGPSSVAPGVLIADALIDKILTLHRQDEQEVEEVI